MIDISKLDKDAVLAALYNAAKPQGLGFLHYDPQPMTLGEAHQFLLTNTYFDYLKGRVMKVKVGGPTLETWGYNRDNGAEAAECVLESLVETGDANNLFIQTLHGMNTTDSIRDLKIRWDQPSKSTKEADTVTYDLGISEFKPQLQRKLESLGED